MGMNNDSSNESSKEKLHWRGLYFGMTNHFSKGYTALFYLYLALVLYVTLFAWDYGSSLGPHGPGGRNYNLIPLKSIIRILTYGTLTMKIDILFGNILMFIPFGILFPLSFRKISRMLIVPFALLLSVFIETNQFIFTYRVSNIDDVILNTLGAAFGLVLYLIYIKLKKVYSNIVYRSHF